MYVDIQSRRLVPFCQQVYPDGHRFMQDNDPKHTSRRAKNSLKTTTSTGGEHPPRVLMQTPNSIENLWPELLTGGTYVGNWNFN